MTQQQRIALDGMLRSLPLDLGGDVAEQRELFAQMMETIPLAEDVVTERGELGGVPVVAVGINGASARGTILYFHGGAYTIGAAELSAGLASELARRSGTQVVSVEYALAPESPYPAAVEDAVAAYRGLRERGVPARDIVLAGESAGGGLALAAAMAIRSAGMDAPAGIYVASPWVDLTLSGRSATTKAAVDPSVTAEGLARRARDYASEADLRDALISPVFGDFSGLPPLLVQVGGNEVLLDDATRLAARAAAHQVSVRLEVTPGVPHVFVAFAGMLDEADAALTHAAGFIRTVLDTRPG
ncbi:alpha/beta hydrolase [Microbacterium lushaniae]|nr:alpha/beta hydrolase [Microbacterium lushaniae]KAA9157669.1 alpha/beta hydrolase [Microbacterium lushaniae]